MLKPNCQSRWGRFLEIGGSWLWLEKFGAQGGVGWTRGRLDGHGGGQMVMMKVGWTGGKLDRHIGGWMGMTKVG